ncbi:MAG: hypothetical protein E6J02_06215 [Chloroflexi bacterium]|nr:MAG: hypothetical protein E6J02_06215 [Chloroflexota bacterium]
MAAKKSQNRRQQAAQQDEQSDSAREPARQVGQQPVHPHLGDQLRVAAVGVDHGRETLDLVAELA